MRRLDKKEVREVHKDIKEADKKVHFDFFFRYRYKKITILALSIIITYIIFTRVDLSSVFPSEDVKLISIFIAGIILAFGFLAPIAAGFFISITPESIFLAAAIATVGTVIADLFIFKFVKISFMDEFQSLKESPIISEFNSAIDNSVFHKIKIYLYYSFIGFVIASPLPDEIGITMLAGLTKIKTAALIIISYVLHFIGISILFMI